MVYKFNNAQKMHTSENPECTLYGAIMDTSYSISQRKKNVGILTWYLRTNAGGRITYKSLKTKNKKKADAALDQMKAQRFSPNLEGTGDEEMTTVIDEWLRHIEFRFGKNSKTTAAYRSRIAQFRSFCNSYELKKYSSVTPFALEKFAQQCAIYAPKTQLEIIKTARMCVEWGIDNFNLPERDKFKAIHVKNVKPSRHEFWTPEEIDAILSQAPNDAYRALWALMAYAGLRFAEARNLRAENCRNGIIQVINGKGGKDADVPMSSKLSTIIAPYIERDGLLIPENDVPTRSDKAIVELKIAVRMAKASGEEISHHKLRHSFASELLRKGVNPEAVKELMRHSGSMEVLFKHYAHVQRNDLKEAVELL